MWRPWANEQRHDVEALGNCPVCPPLNRAMPLPAPQVRFHDFWRYVVYTSSSVRMEQTHSIANTTAQATFE